VFPDFLQGLVRGAFSQQQFRRIPRGEVQHQKTMMETPSSVGIRINIRLMM
jgi:hypothetical protein